MELSEAGNGMGPINKWSNLNGDNLKDANFQNYPDNRDMLIMNEMQANLNRAINDNIDKTSVSVLNLDEIDSSQSQN